MTKRELAALRERFEAAKRTHYSYVVAVRSFTRSEFIEGISEIVDAVLPALRDYETALEAMEKAETALAKLQRSKATYTLQQYVTDCNECHRQSASNLLPEHEYFCSSLERDDALAALRKATGKEDSIPTSVARYIDDALGHAQDGGDV